MFLSFAELYQEYLFVNDGVDSARFLLAYEACQLPPRRLDVVPLITEVQVRVQVEV